MSPAPPPLAAWGLVEDTELFIKFNKEGFKPTLLLIIKVPFSVMVFEFTFASYPPPIRYDSVNVVLAGTCPYALVYKKFEGS